MLSDLWMFFSPFVLITWSFLYGIVEDEGIDTDKFNSKGTSILETWHDDLAENQISFS